MIDFRQNGLRSYNPSILGGMAPMHPWSTHRNLVLPSSCAEHLGVCLLPKAYGDSQLHLPCCPCPCVNGLTVRALPVVPVSSG